MKKFSVLLMMLGLLASCNTIKGVGEDIQASGTAVEKASDKTKDAIKNNINQNKTNTKKHRNN